MCSKHTQSLQLLVVLLMLVMFSINVMFLVDLSINHQNLQGSTPQITVCIQIMLSTLCVCVCCVCVERWWGSENERENGREEPRGRRGGGEKALRRFLSLRVESSHERVGVYSGDETVSLQLSSRVPSFTAVSLSIRYTVVAVRTRGVCMWSYSTKLRYVYH